jgi:hypothetical protein
LVNVSGMGRLGSLDRGNPGLNVSSMVGGVDYIQETLYSVYLEWVGGVDYIEKILDSMYVVWVGGVD